MVKQARIIAFLTFLCLSAYGQENEIRKAYTTSGGELIFSLANMTYGDVDVDPVVRFSGFFNAQTFLNYDFSSSFGLFSGLSIRNIGFIYDVPNSNIRKKVRTYNVGIPIGFKFGNLNRVFLYGGYEFELPINYKEKTFVNDDKDDKFDAWFSNRTNSVFHTLFVGVQLPYGTNLKFKYYLTSFFNEGYKEKDDSGNTIMPYDGIDANIFYFSLSFNMFKNDQFYHKQRDNNVDL
jgi:hypothetical protein